MTKDERHAILPPGNASTFTGISENFSFHASPERFIQQLTLKHYQHLGDRTAVRAKILNRSVVIVSAYAQVKQVLEDANQAEAGTSYVAAAPYRQLMADFFPAPNLLLTDGCPHHQMRMDWETTIQDSCTGSEEQKLRDVCCGFVSRIERNTPFDLYSSLKDLAWQLLLSQFFGQLGEDSRQEYIMLQEDLLRGQFSLFPVSVSTPFWQSARKRGIEARKKLQTMIAGAILETQPTWLSNGCAGKRAQEEVVNHILMATSSLAVKAFASLMLAFLLNVYLFEDPRREPGLCSDAGGRTNADESKPKQEAIFWETARLSPPIVGIMRRAITNSILKGYESSDSDILVPESWDVWLYFPGANRDRKVFGQDADHFRPERYCSENDPEPLIFGLGFKRCLGAKFILKAALAVLAAFEGAGVKIEGEVLAAGVRGWLGWHIATLDEWANDMKQIPTQRPSKPIKVRVISS